VWPVGAYDDEMLADMYLLAVLCEPMSLGRPCESDDAVRSFTYRGSAIDARLHTCIAFGPQSQKTWPSSDAHNDAVVLWAGVMCHSSSRANHAIAGHRIARHQSAGSAGTKSKAAAAAGAAAAITMKSRGGYGREGQKCTRTAVSSGEVYSRISVHRLEQRMVPRFCWLLFRLQESLNSMYGLPVSTCVETDVQVSAPERRP